MRIERISWNDHAEKSLTETLREDREWLKHEVSTGIANLYCIDEKSYAITRLEHIPGFGQEFVVCCYAGERLNDFAAYAIKKCKQKNIKSIRFHTRRPGLPRLLKKFNVEFIESVYKCKVV